MVVGVKTATFQRSTSMTRPHVIVINLGEGDLRELTIHQAQHLFESLDMAIMELSAYNAANPIGELIR